MKPKIFLSHSKKDQEFVLKVSHALRYAGIESWYDEWEIPIGESIRKKIFDDGLPNCDLFFIYLTENSINSHWVKEELEGMFTLQSEQKLSLLLPCVSHADLRSKLSVDLRGKNILELNDENFYKPLTKIISKTWEEFSQKERRRIGEAAVLQIEMMKNENLTLKNQILEMHLTGNVDTNSIIRKLTLKVYNRNDSSVELSIIFVQLKKVLAKGTKKEGIGNLLDSYKTRGNTKSDDFWQPDYPWREFVDDVIAELILLGLVKRTFAMNEGGRDNEDFSLTELGIQIAQNL